MMKTYVIVTGVGTKKKYYEPFLSHIEDSVFEYCIYKLKPFRSIESQATDLRLILTDLRKNNVHLIGFSLGCVLVMKLLENDMVSSSVNHVTLINPSNIEMDNIQSSYYKYKLIWSLPSFLKRMYMFFYRLTTMKNLEEPSFLMEDIIFTPFDSLFSMVKEIGMSQKWNTLIGNCKYNRRIRIISGEKDRYHEFSKMLADIYSEQFTMRVIPGKHHIIYTNPEQTSSSIL